MTSLSDDQRQNVLIRLLLQSRSLLQLCQGFAGLPAGRITQSSEHPFAAPPNPSSPDWCVCRRCAPMPTDRENVCCGNRECTSSNEYFRATVLDPDVLQVQIRYHADFLNIRPDYRPASFRKAAYRMYVLGKYGYLGAGNREVAPSCAVRCIRHWYPSPTGDYMGYRSS